MHTMLEKCLTDAATLSATRDAQFADRWSAVMAKQDVKIGLVKTKVAAKKRTQDMAFLMTGTAEMPPAIKAWFDSQCAIILQEMSAATETATTETAATATPTSVAEESSATAAPASSSVDPAATEEAAAADDRA
jgi:hypothetical protein